MIVRFFSVKNRVFFIYSLWCGVDGERKKNNRSVHKDGVDAVEFRERGGKKKKGALYFIIIHFILIDDSLPRTFNSNIVLNLMRVCVFLTKSDGLLEH